MLQQIEGHRVPNIDLSTSSFEEVLIYYDGPRLVLRRSLAGQLYLAWWSDSDESVERWVYLPLSESRLRQILTGEIPSRDALNNPEDGYLLVADIDTDGSFETIMAVASSLPQDALPVEEATLDIPIPDEIMGFSTRERAHLLDVKIETLGMARPGQAAAEAVSKVVGDLQRLIDSLGQALSNHAAEKGPIPRSIKRQTQLNFVGAYSGSLGLRLETDSQDSTSGDSLVRRSLGGLFELLEASYQSSETNLRQDILTPRVATNYVNLLTTIQTTSRSTTLGWTTLSDRRLRELSVSSGLAKATKTRFRAATRDLLDELQLEGTFLSGNTRTLRFSLRESSYGGLYSVRIPRTLYREISPITLDFPYRVVLQPSLVVSETTGEGKISYSLVNLTPIELYR